MYIPVHIAGRRRPVVSVACACRASPGSCALVAGDRTPRMRVLSRAKYSLLHESEINYHHLFLDFQCFSLYGPFRQNSIDSIDIANDKMC